MSRATTTSTSSTFPAPNPSSLGDNTESTNVFTTDNRPTSYVWLHFRKLCDRPVNKCAFIMGDGNECGKELARNKKGSTKSMKSHLESKHGSRDAYLPDQTNILAAFKKVKTNHMVSFTLLYIQTDM